MQRFYERLNESAGRRSKAGALAEAQRELHATKELGHPYYWAPFILVGTESRTAGDSERDCGEIAMSDRKDSNAVDSVADRSGARADWRWRRHR